MVGSLWAPQWDVCILSNTSVLGHFHIYLNANDTLGTILTLSGTTFYFIFYFFFEGEIYYDPFTIPPLVPVHL